MPLSASSRQTAPSWPAALVLGLTGLALNQISAPILGPSSPLFILGGAPVFLALLALGPTKAVVAYAISQAVLPPAPILLWAIPVYLLELLGTAVIYRRTGSLCFAVALYWLSLGWAVDLAVYQGAMGLSFDYTVLVFVKQILGGLMNAMAAEGLLMIWWSPPVRRLRGLPAEAIPLRAYVFRPVMFAVLLSTTTVALVHLRAEYQIRTEAEEARLTEEAAALVAQLERLGRAREETLAVLIKSRRRPGTVWPSENQLTDFHAGHPEFLNLIVTDASGRAVATSPIVNARGERLRGVSLAGRAYWRHSRDTLRPGYSPLVLGTLHVRDPTDPEPVLPFSLALTDEEGRFSGALVASLDGREVAQILPPRRISDQMTVTDQEGVVIASTDPGRPPGSRAFIPESPPGSLRHVFRFTPQDPQNQFRLDVRRVAVDHVVGSGWKVLAEARIDTLHAAMVTQAFATLALILLMIAPLYLVFARLNDDLVRPLIALDSLASEIANSPEGVADSRIAAHRDLSEAPVAELRRLAANLVSTERVVSQRVRQTAGDLALSLESLSRAAEKDAELRVILEKAALEWERTFDAIEGPVVLVDARDQIVRGNRSARALLGSDPEPFPLARLAGTEPWATVLDLVTTMRVSHAPSRRDAGGHRDRCVWDVSVFPQGALEPKTADDRGDAVVVIRSVTDERRISAQRELLTQLWTALSEVEHLTEATAVILRHLCEFAGADAGQVFVLNPQGTEFRCVPSWFGPESARPLHDVSRQLAFPVGADVPGWVWSSEEPRWVEDFPSVATPMGAAAARAAGLRSMMCIPVRSGHALVAMVELFWREGQGEAPATQEFLGAAVSQFGALIERYRSQEALQQHERSHSILLSNLSGMAYRTANDAAGTMTYASDGCLELTGYDSKALCSGAPPFAALVEPADRDRRRETCEASLSAGRPYVSEYRIRTAAGVEKWVWDQAQGIYGADGELESIEGFISDITPRKQAEVELQRATTMGAMGALLAGVAHEVRNPLFAISANIDAFEARFGARPEFSGTIESLRESLRRLIVLMDDLLEYGRPTVDRLDPAEVATVAREAVAICADLAHQFGVEVLVEERGVIPRVSLDRARMVAVFKNLIENAIQHTTLGGRVEVGLAPAAFGVACWVRDRGPGFADRDLPQVFEPFFTRRHGGSGLGLAIVQRIVLAHGGAVRASNRPEGGAELLIQLPVSPH